MAPEASAENILQLGEEILDDLHVLRLLFLDHLFGQNSVGILAIDMVPKLQSAFAFLEVQGYFLRALNDVE